MEIKKLLRPLSDGEWHQLEDLSTETKISRVEVLMVADSLRGFGFLELNLDKTAVKLSDDFLKL
jgi:hypothetical protein